MIPQLALSIQNVSLRLGGVLVLDNTTAQIKNNGHGHVIGILGPSGVGKTSLIRIIAGLQQPDSGGVFIGDDKQPVRRGSVGVVSQNYPLFRNRTVLGNLKVASNQVTTDRKAVENKSVEMLERFGLKDKADCYPQQLSGGMRQRVAIAQQLLCSEHLLVFDEPFSGLDPINTRKVSGLITDVANLDETNTVMIVTHDIPAAVSVSDTLWLLGREHNEAGRVIPGAKVKEVYDLVGRGLAWHSDVMLLPAFQETVTEIRAKFDEL